MTMSERIRQHSHGAARENLRIILLALLIALFIRAFLYQPFNIPSGSMRSTLLVGDYLFVSKFTYGYSRHSLPFSLPLISGRIFSSGPERGDVVVFKNPVDNETDYIKRVIGLPGDRIQMRAGVLYINGEPVQMERVEDFIQTDVFGNMRRTARYLETLPNGVTHVILDENPRGPSDNTGVYLVPSGHYFMMGDNRDNSTDSRVLSAVGYVPLQNLVGRADFLFFSTDGSARIWEFWGWPQAIRWERFFQAIE